MRFPSRHRPTRRGQTDRQAERHRPVRTCIGCGRKAPKDELVRFVAADGSVVSDAEAPGRAAYTCRRLSCFERAAAHNAFSRTLKASVRVDRQLSRLYT